MSDPRIATFARVASGNIPAKRIIEGQNTKLTRVAHGITYDPVHDLIIATEPLAASIVFFRGGAHGDVPPVRVIQGNKTLIHSPYEPSVDNQHNELWIADITSGALRVYPLEDNGNIAPLRNIQGPKTQLFSITGVAVDPVHDLVVAAGLNRQYRPCIFIFRRTDNGDVAPLRVISGPTTGLEYIWHVQVAGQRIFATASNFYYIPPYDPGGHEPRKDCTGPPLPFPGPLGFIGVWNESDNGDVAPRAIIRGAQTDLLHPVGLVLDPAHGQVFASDSVRNGVFGFLVPNFFK
ncbi:MAG TPA: hypothetical protein VKV28_01760 [Candidatus Binataceae bacterium]|nr:hypothetical protein [Candidatus Binataceae bacterium]